MLALSDLSVSPLPNSTIWYICSKTADLPIYNINLISVPTINVQKTTG